MTVVQKFCCWLLFAPAAYAASVSDAVNERIPVSSAALEAHWQVDCASSWARFSDAGTQAQCRGELRYCRRAARRAGTVRLYLPAPGNSGIGGMNRRLHGLLPPGLSAPPSNCWILPARPNSVPNWRNFGSLGEAALWCGQSKYLMVLVGYCDSLMRINKCTPRVSTMCQSGAWWFRLYKLHKERSNVRTGSR